MSKELQERADRISKELEDSLVSLAEEIRRFKQIAKRLTNQRK